MYCWGGRKPIASVLKPKRSPTPSLVLAQCGATMLCPSFSPPDEVNFWLGVSLCPSHHLKGYWIPLLGPGALGSPAKFWLYQGKPIPEQRWSLFWGILGFGGIPPKGIPLPLLDPRLSLGILPPSLRSQAQAWKWAVPGLNLTSVTPGVSAENFIQIGTVLNYNTWFSFVPRLASVHAGRAV